MYKELKVRLSYQFHLRLSCVLMNFKRVIPTAASFGGASIGALSIISDLIVSKSIADSTFSSPSSVSLKSST